MGEGVDEDWETRAKSLRQRARVIVVTELPLDLLAAAGPWKEQPEADG